MVAVSTSQLQSSIHATTPLAAAECQEPTRNKTDAAAHNKVLLLTNVAKHGVMQSVIMTYSIMNIITSFIWTLDYTSIFALSQPVRIIEVGLYMYFCTWAILFMHMFKVCKCARKALKEVARKTYLRHLFDVGYWILLRAFDILLNFFTLKVVIQCVCVCVCVCVRMQYLLCHNPFR